MPPEPNPDIPSTNEIQAVHEFTERFANGDLDKTQLDRIEGMLNEALPILRKFNNLVDAMEKIPFMRNLAEGKGAFPGLGGG